MNMASLLRKRRENAENNTALIVNDAAISFSELDTLVDIHAGKLKATGIKHGDVVASMLPNGLEYVVNYFSVLRLGAIFMPIDIRTPIAELKLVFEDANPKALVSGSRCVEASLLKWFDKEKITLKPGIMTHDTLKEPNVNLIGDADILDDEPVIYMYTSGSTGRPKGVILPNRALEIFPEGCCKLFGLKIAEHVLGVSMPMSHIGGPIYLNVLATFGTRLVIVEPFRPDRFLKAISKHKITVFHSVPPIITSLLQVPNLERYNLSSLQWIAPMGMSVPVSLIMALESVFSNAYVIQGYGLTETAGMLTALTKGNTKRKRGSIGSILVPATEIKIIDEWGKDLNDGEVGELVISGKCLMLGYHNCPELNTNMMKDGWFYTGDLGCRDKEGFFYHKGRKDDVINVGGLKVYPAEIEEVILQHPKVKETCVLGIANARRGKAIKAFVRLIPGQNISEKDLIHFLKDRMVNYKVPRQVEYLERLPKTSNGKIDKALLLTCQAAYL